MTSVPNTVWIRQFNVVVEEGSLLAAAKRLRISQPALSKNIRSLERELGTALFTRHARGMSINAFGQILLEKSRRIEVEYAYAAQEIRNLMAGTRGVLRIGAGPFWATAVMPAAITTFHQRQPRHQVQLVTGAMDELIGQVEDGRLDIAAGSVAPSEIGSGLLREPLTEIQLAILAHEKHPLVRLGRPITASELSAHPFVGYKPNWWAMGLLANLFAMGNSPPPTFSVETTSLIAGLELVRSGQYLMLEARPIVEGPVGFHIVALETETPIYSFPAGLIRPRSAVMSPMLKEFRSVLIETFTKLQHASRHSRADDFSPSGLRPVTCSMSVRDEVD